jgi:hypothetical protein
MQYTMYMETEKQKSNTSAPGFTYNHQCGCVNQIAAISIFFCGHAAFLLVGFADAVLAV